MLGLEWSKLAEGKCYTLIWAPNLTNMNPKMLQSGGESSSLSRYHWSEWASSALDLMGGIGTVVLHRRIRFWIWGMTDLVWI